VVAGMGSPVAGGGSLAAEAGPVVAGMGSPVAGDGSLAAGGGPAVAGTGSPALSPLGTACGAVGRPASKSNPQDSQNRPDLAVPHRGQGSAATGGCCSGGAPDGVLAETPILTPQTSQKSTAADV
jgi:hypothetical protein